jgi:hypothetical protein
MGVITFAITWLFFLLDARRREMELIDRPTILESDRRVPIQKRRFAVGMRRSVPRLFAVCCPITGALESPDAGCPFVALVAC